MSLLSDRLGPAFSEQYGIRKFRVMKHTGMSGASTFNLSSLWNKELQTYTEMNQPVEIRDGEIFDCVMVKVEAVTIALMALQLDELVCSVSNDTFQIITSEEKSKEKYWFWLKEI